MLSTLSFRFNSTSAILEHFMFSMKPGIQEIKIQNTGCSDYLLNDKNKSWRCQRRSTVPTKNLEGDERIKSTRGSIVWHQVMYFHRVWELCFVSVCSKQIWTPHAIHDSLLQSIILVASRYSSDLCKARGARCGE